MNLDTNDIIELDGITCCILLDEIINGTRYLYVSELEDEDITENFYLYKEVQGEYTRLTDSEELKKVLPSVIQLLNKQL